MKLPNISGALVGITVDGAEVKLGKIDYREDSPFPIVRLDLDALDDNLDKLRAGPKFANVNIVFYDKDLRASLLADSKEMK